MSNIEKGDIITLVMATGEVVGRYLDTDVDEWGIPYVELENPRMLGATEEGIGFYPSIAVSARKELPSVRFNLQNILCVVKTRGDVEEVWTEATSVLARV